MQEQDFPASLSVEELVDGASEDVLMNEERKKND